LHAVPGAILCDLYLRLSDGRREEALTGREAKLRAEAQRLGWTVNRTVRENDINADGTLKPASAFKRVKTIRSDGSEEWRVKRPGFDSVISDLMNGHAHALLAEDLDRLARDPMDLEDLITCAERKGSIIRSASTGEIHLETSDGRVMARVVCAFSRKESEDKGRRVADARERLAPQSYGGGRRGYGFVAAEDTVKYHRKLIVVPDEAEVIVKAYADILDLKLSLRVVVKQLIADGVPTVTGARWTPSNLKDILTKSSLPGLKDDAGNVVIPEIIPQDRYDAMVSLLTDPDRRLNTANANTPRWLCTGIAVCGRCGGSIRCAGAANRRGYVCSVGGHVRRDAAKVDELVASWAVWRLSQDDAADLLKPIPRAGVDIAGLRSEARKLGERKSALARMFAEDGDERALASGLKVIRDRLAVVESQLAASDESDPIPEFRTSTPAAQVWNALSLPRKRAVVRVLMDVVILPATRGRGGFDPESVQISFDKSA
jgi:DNA invertase Pin-like site-specific DNA recombinase